ncbi:MAG TPA: DUF2339 domain-containing protein [Gemmatimonadales bacterium]
MTPEGEEDSGQRLDALERAVAALREEVTALRAELRDSRAEAPARGAHGDPFARMGASAAPAPAPTPVAPRPAPVGATAATRATVHAAALRGRLRVESLDLESLVGRYGTMILGALTILLGVGAFLSWAVQRVTLGPGMRVGLGALGAAAVAALGAWLRQRDADGTGTRRFGNVLLALSLALVHVVAWGAGPALQVVPSGVALLVAAAASVTLAVLAWRAGEQALFVMGMGGALLAPFVTSSEAGNPLLLLGYGTLLVVAALLAQRERDWPWARRVLSFGVMAYTAAAMGVSEVVWPGGAGAWLREAAPALFVLVCAVAAIAAGGRAARSTLARQWLLVLVVPLLAGASFGAPGRHEPHLVALALVGTALFYLALRLRDARQPLDAPSALVQPPLLLLAALAALPEAVDLAGALASLLWAALAFAAAWDAGARAVLAGDASVEATFEADARDGAERSAVAGLPLWAIHLLVAGMLAVVAVVLATHDGSRLAGAVALAATGVGTALLAARARAPMLLLTPVAALVTATSWVTERLNDRVPYEYVPFASVASLTAVVVVAGWWIAGRLAARGVAGPGIGPIERRLLGAAGPIAAFLWGHVELENAFSPDLSEFLVILYIATAGVLCIALGRRWRVPGGRRVGLALAVWGALRALAQASGFDSVGLRVSAYLLVGIFLLGVAYWYRAAGEAKAAS